MKKNFIISFLFSHFVLAAAVEIKEFPAKGLNEIKIENISGLVNITAAEGEKVSVAATKTKFSDKCTMSIEMKDKKLLVKVERSTLFSNENCDVNFEIKTPKSVNVNHASGSGDLKITGLQGKLDFKIGSGAVSAEGSFDNIEGNSGSGNIAIKGLTGNGKFNAGSGEINLTYSTAKLNGALDINTASGDATLFFPKGTSIQTKFRASSGELSNELGDNPKASYKVSMKAASGNLTIKAY